MEARKKFFTFGEALNKIQADPENLAMTRQKYYDEDILIKEVIPTVISPGEIYPKRPALIMKQGSDEVYWTPTQEDLHANNWFLLRKKPNKNTKLDSEDKDLLLELKNIINHLLENEK